MRSDKRSLFVTGGAGFIGSAFVRLLLEGFETVRVERIRSGAYRSSHGREVGAQ